MDIGVQTKGILPEMDAEQGVSLIANAGFTRVDFNLDTFLKNTNVYSGKINNFFDTDIEELFAFFGNYKDVMNAHGIRPSQMHAPYPIYVPGKDAISEYMQQVVIPKSIAIAEKMEIPWVVFHPFKMQYQYGLEAEQAMNITFFQKILPLLKKYHVGACVENLYESIGGRLVEGTCANPADACFYVDMMNDIAGEEVFGCCLDTGHMQLTHTSPADYVRAVGSRLKILHVHENDAFADLHQMPYTFGNKKSDGIDWAEFRNALDDVGFDGTISFETFPCFNSFPPSVREEVLRTIHEIGKNLVDAD